MYNVLYIGKDQYNNLLVNRILLLPVLLKAYFFKNQVMNTNM